MVEAMEIPEGFKKTDVGVIPYDWEAIPLNNISVSIASGKSKTKSQIGGKFPIYGSTGIIGFSLTYDYDGKKILVARVGANAGTVNFVEGKYCVSDNTLMVQLNKEADFTFVLCFLRYSNLNKLIFGSGQPLITGTQLKLLPVALPPTEAEQTVIATALNDTDALITHLEKLIAKKRAIKQGAMRELLKPKEGWEEKTIEEIFDVTAGGDFKKQFSSVIKDETHKYPIYSNSLSDDGLYGYCSYYTSDENCITVTARGTIGFANYRDHKFTAIGRVLVLRPKVVVDCFYASEYINNKINFVLEVTGVPQLTAPQISKYTISFPNTKLEQTRIAQILSDLDAEIEALEKKLDKYKMLKQGMMQNLLTGRIRLI